MDTVERAIDSTAFSRICAQRIIPVVVRRKKERLVIRLPYAEDNRQWLVAGRRQDAVWDRERQFWHAPASWFNDFVNRALVRYGKLYIVQPYREQEVCAPACWNALGHICECSCLGANHGGGQQDGFFEISEALAVKWGEEILGCRLMVAKPRIRCEPVIPAAVSPPGGVRQITSDEVAGYIKRLPRRL